MNSILTLLKKFQIANQVKILWFIFFLSAILIKPIFINPVQEISPGNLEKFYELTATDPFFYDPAMDAVFLHEAIVEMKRIDDKILYVDRLFRSSGDPKYRGVFPVSWRLWPDEFLATLPYIHVATKKFLDAPSRAGAEILLAWYEKAAVSYKKSIYLHIQAMENIFRVDPKMPKSKIAFLGSAVTPQIVYDDFLLIQKNAMQLTKEISERKRCLYSGNCRVSDVSGPVSDVGGRVSDVVPFNPLPNEILGINGKFGTDFFGPYRAETGCFGFTDSGGGYKSQPFYVVIKKSEQGGKPWLKAVLSNEQYYTQYYSVSNNNPLRQKVAVAHLARGLKYRPQPATNDYICTDLTYLPELIFQYLGKYRFLQSKNKLATLPHLIKNTVTYSPLLILSPLYAKQPYTPLTLLITRSAYSIYFGAFTPAVWRLTEKPKFLLRQNFDLNKIYETYRQLLERGLDFYALKTLQTIPSYQEVFFGK